MKKLTLLFLLIFGAYAAYAQNPGTVTVETAEYHSEHEPIIATAIFVPSSTSNPATSHTWQITPCDEEGNYTGEALFSESYTGAPGTAFEFPGSADFPQQNYRVDCYVEDGQQLYSNYAVTKTSNPATLDGSTSDIAMPGDFRQSFGHTLTLPAGTFKYTLTFSGGNFLVVFGLQINASGVPPNVNFTSAGVPLSVGFLYNLAQNAPVCGAESVLITFIDVSSGNAAGTFTYTVNCMDQCNQTTIRMNSGLYYKGDDNHIHRMYWANNTWNYQAVTPLGGWGSVQVDGWLSGDFSGYDIYFRGKDGKPYRLYVGNPTTLTAIGGVNDVQSDLQLRSSTQMIYIGTDNRIHLLNLSGGVWSPFTINPPGGYNGNIPQALAWEGGTNGNIYFRTLSTNAIVGLWYTVFPTPTWQLIPMPSGPGCNGDMVYDDPGQVLYFKGTDNLIHRDKWNSSTSQWVYESMSSPTGNVPATNSLTHIQGTDNIVFKGANNRVYYSALTNGTWQTNWLVGNYTNVAGDLLCDWTDIYFVSRSKEIGSYWYNGSTWFVGPLNNNSPKNAVGCSSKFRMAGPVVSAGNEAFNIYPNPSNGTFQVTFGDETNGAQAELFNLMGERVDAFTVSGTSYNYSPSITLNSGVYLLRITNKGQTMSRRIVIE